VLVDITNQYSSFHIHIVDKLDMTDENMKGNSDSHENEAILVFSDGNTMMNCF
jgi:hypothetical protein